MDCLVEDCQRELVEGRDFCVPHLRRFIAGHIYEDEDGALRDHCIRGHAFTEANTRWETSSTGRVRRRCRACGREKAARQAARKAELPPEPPKAYRPEDPTLTQAILDFDKARQFVPGNCLGREEEFIDWAFDNELPTPTAEQAAELCAGCPLLKACDNYRIAAKEQWGVWGGKVIVDGEVVR